MTQLVPETRAAGSDTPAARSVELQAWWWRHPEVPAIAGITGSWVALTAYHWSTHNEFRAAGDQAWSFSPLWWAVMVVAMMLPGSVPMLRRVAFNSMWRRRHRSATLFASTYVGAWVAAGVASFATIRLIELFTGSTFAPGRFEVAAILIAAAGWQLTATKRRCLRRCHLRTPLAPRGWKADRSVIAYGWFHAKACIGSCIALMAAMFVSAHDFHLMAPLAAITIVERYQRKPNTAASATAIVIVAGLALVA